MSDSIDTAKERAVLNDFNLLMDMADRKPAFTISGAMPEIVTITHRFSAALDEIDRLTAERDEARAQVAMAYEAADGVLGKHCFHEGHWARRDIRALTPDDAKAALEARDAAKDAEIDRLRSALEACLNYIENTEGEFGIILDCADKGRAALTDTPPSSPRRE